MRKSRTAAVSLPIRYFEPQVGVPLGFLGGEPLLRLLRGLLGNLLLEIGQRPS